MGPAMKFFQRKCHFHRFGEPFHKYEKSDHAGKHSILIFKDYLLISCTVFTCICFYIKVIRRKLHVCQVKISCSSIGIDKTCMQTTSDFIKIVTYLYLFWASCIHYIFVMKYWKTLHIGLRTAACTFIKKIKCTCMH